MQPGCDLVALTGWRQVRIDKSVGGATRVFGVGGPARRFRESSDREGLLLACGLDHRMINPRLTPIVAASVLDVAPSFAMIELM